MPSCPRCHGLGRVPRFSWPGPCTWCGVSGPCPHRTESVYQDCPDCRGGGYVHGKAGTAKPITDDVVAQQQEATSLLLLL